MKAWIGVLLFLCFACKSEDSGPGWGVQGSGEGDGDSDGSGDGDADSDGDGDSDADSDGDSDGDADTGTVVYTCDEGAELHLSSSGKAFCCPPEYPVFCDENDAGYTGNCWSEGVDCDTLIDCGSGWQACPEGTESYCNGATMSCRSPCTDGTLYTTASGRQVCCSEPSPQFCDENDQGFAGGCWDADVDCDTITSCNGSFSACLTGSIPFCGPDGFECIWCPEGYIRTDDPDGRPHCCSPENPLYCPANDAGFEGGCWPAGKDCGTLLLCNGGWFICDTGEQSSCVSNTPSCS
jgi:hypothetical protein